MEDDDEMDAIGLYNAVEAHLDEVLADPEDEEEQQRDQQHARIGRRRSSCIGPLEDRGGPEDRLHLPNGLRHSRKETK